MTRLHRVWTFFGMRFLQFAFFGGLAMFLDMAVLWIATNLGHFNLYSGRAVSFFCAATCTWFLNRTVTFKGIRTHSILVEYLRFLGVAMIGGVVNLGVYSVMIFAAPRMTALPHAWAPLLPYFAVACGSASGLVFNYAGSRLAVFRGIAAVSSEPNS
jgi:putative flippase GtrA